MYLKKDFANAITLFWFSIITTNYLIKNCFIFLVLFFGFFYSAFWTPKN